MLRESARCLVGLIAIETLPHVGGSGTADHESTLSQFLVHLAAGRLPDTASDLAIDDAPAVLTVQRLSRRTPGRRVAGLRKPSSRIAADLGSLAAELRQDLVKVRRQLARATQ